MMMTTTVVVGAVMMVGREHDFDDGAD